MTSGSAGEILFWKRVAEDLGIEIEAPFETALPTAERLSAIALVRNFGPASGMLIEPNCNTSILRQSGYGYCFNFGSPSDQYDRLAMIEVLKDWKWSGPENAVPDWHG